MTQFIDPYEQLRQLQMQKAASGAPGYEMFDQQQSFEALSAENQFLIHQNLMNKPRGNLFTDIDNVGKDWGAGILIRGIEVYESIRDGWDLVAHGDMHYMDVKQKREEAEAGGAFTSRLLTNELEKFQESQRAAWAGEISWGRSFSHGVVEFGLGLTEFIVGAKTGAGIGRGISKIMGKTDDVALAVASRRGGFAGIHGVLAMHANTHGRHIAEETGDRTMGLFSGFVHYAASVLILRQLHGAATRAEGDAWKFWYAMEEDTVLALRGAEEKVLTASAEALARGNGAGFVRFLQDAIKITGTAGTVRSLEQLANGFANTLLKDSVLIDSFDASWANVYASFMSGVKEGAMLHMIPVVSTQFRVGKSAGFRITSSRDVGRQAEALIKIRNAHIKIGRNVKGSEAELEVWVKRLEAIDSGNPMFTQLKDVVEQTLNHLKTGEDIEITSIKDLIADMPIEARMEVAREYSEILDTLTEGMNSSGALGAIKVERGVETRAEAGDRILNESLDRVAQTAGKDVFEKLPDTFKSKYLTGVHEDKMTRKILSDLHGRDKDTAIVTLYRKIKELEERVGPDTPEVMALKKVQLAALKKAEAAIRIMRTKSVGDVEGIDPDSAYLFRVAEFTIKVGSITYTEAEIAGILGKGSRGGKVPADKAALQKKLMELGAKKILPNYKKGELTGEKLLDALRVEMAARGKAQKGERAMPKDVLKMALDFETPQLTGGPRLEELITTQGPKNLRKAWKGFRKKANKIDKAYAREKDAGELTAERQGAFDKEYREAYKELIKVTFKMRTGKDGSRINPLLEKVFDALYEKIDPKGFKKVAEGDVTAKDIDIDAALDAYVEHQGESARPLAKEIKNIYDTIDIEGVDALNTGELSQLAGFVGSVQTAQVVERAAMKAQMDLNTALNVDAMIAEASLEFTGREAPIDPVTGRRVVDSVSVGMKLWNLGKEFSYGIESNGRLADVLEFMSGGNKTIMHKVLYGDVMRGRRAAIEQSREFQSIVAEKYIEQNLSEGDIYAESQTNPRNVIRMPFSRQLTGRERGAPKEHMVVVMKMPDGQTLSLTRGEVADYLANASDASTVAEWKAGVNIQLEGSLAKAHPERYKHNYKNHLAVMEHLKGPEYEVLRRIAKAHVEAVNDARVVDRLREWGVKERGMDIISGQTYYQRKRWLSSRSPGFKDLETRNEISNEMLEGGMSDYAALDTSPVEMRTGGGDYAIRITDGLANINQYLLL